MSETTRKPQSFAIDDPDLVIAEPGPRAGDGRAPKRSDNDKIALPTRQDLKRGFRWGAMLLAAMGALASLAAALWFARFVSVALARNDWVGWFAFALFGLAALATAVLIAREVLGLIRLGSLGRLRKGINTALASKDVTQERDAVRLVENFYAGRRDMRWGLDRLAQHRADVRDPGELLALADREVMAPLDIAARRAVLASAKRVMTVTALSPMMLIGVAFVVIENMRLLRSLATLYGGRPGVLGSLKLARLVATHLVATGSLALTDDLVGQFLGQDLLRRLSRRLGEGAFNGALTARVGAAAIEVIRPLPFLDAPRVRVRDILRELFRKDDALGPVQSA